MRQICCHSLARQPLHTRYRRYIRSGRREIRANMPLPLYLVAMLATMRCGHTSAFRIQPLAFSSIRPWHIHTPSGSRPTVPSRVNSDVSCILGRPNRRPKPSQPSQSSEGTVRPNPLPTLYFSLQPLAFAFAPPTRHRGPPPEKAVRSSTPLVPLAFLNLQVVRSVVRSRQGTAVNNL